LNQSKTGEAAPVWTKKRRLLVKNLKSVVKRVELGITPVHITELWAYGSFIRTKDEPGDVDLAVFFGPDQELDEKVSRIQDLLVDNLDSHEQLRKMAWDEALKGRVDILVETLDRVFGRDERYRVWLEISRAGWVHEARSHGNWVMNIDVHKIVRTILLRKSKTIHIDSIGGIQPISQKEETLAKKPYRLVWSETARDVDTNIQLMYREAKEAADKELPRFQLQFDQLDAEYSMLTAGISYMLGQQKKGRDITKAQPAEIMEIVYANPSYGSTAKKIGRAHV